MPPFDPKTFLDEPIYAFDFGFMIGDVEDFLEFTESSVEWQFRREMLAVQRQAETQPLEPGYKEHLEANVEHRFKVSLPLRVRYAALIALITSVEWALVPVVGKLQSPLSKIPSGTNATVHALRDLEGRLNMGVHELVSDYEALVRVRDCIVHSAGLERDYKHKADLPRYLARLHGVYLGSWNFLGEHVCIDRGALNPYISGLSQHVTVLHEACQKRSLWREDT